ncbi:YcxB family protein [Saccharothrix isguenensis]
MDISFSVSYDERRLRRVIKFLIRRQLKWVRVMGAVVAIGAAAALATEYVSTWTGAVFIVMGGALAVLSEPYSVAHSMRVQSMATREGYVMTLGETHFAVNAHSYSWQSSWSILEQVVDTPDAWYLMFGRFQAQAVYKELMTEEQRAEFVAFLARRNPARPAA